jgi:hypothetical protein
MGFLDCELAKKLPPNRLVCCNNSDDPSSSCSTDLSNCFAPKELIICYEINNLEACRRIDDIAKTVCQNKDSLYCLWDRGGTIQRLLTKYPLYSKVLIWQFSRNTEAESRGRTRAKYNETTQNYETWTKEDVNSGGSVRNEESVAEVFCSDFFQPQIDCTWIPRLYSNITVLSSFRPTKICNFSNSTTVPTTNSTKIDCDELSRQANLATIIGTPVGVVIGLLGLLTTVRCFKRRREAKKVENQQIIDKNNMLFLCTSSTVSIFLSSLVLLVFTYSAQNGEQGKELLDTVDTSTTYLEEFSWIRCLFFPQVSPLQP